jgi:hypothetical protein
VIDPEALRFSCPFVDDKTQPTAARRDTERRSEPAPFRGQRPANADAAYSFVFGRGERASIVVMDAMRMQIPGGRAVSMVLCD